MGNNLAKIRKHSKSARILFSTVFAMTLTGCQLPYRDIPLMDFTTAQYNTLDYQHDRNTHDVVSSIPIGYALADDGLSYASDGYLVLKNYQGKKALFSLILGTNVTNASYDRFEFLPTKDNGVYAKAIVQDGETYTFQVFDCFGHQVFSCGTPIAADQDDFSIRAETIEGDYRKAVHLEECSFQGKTTFSDVSSDEKRIPYSVRPYLLLKNGQGYWETSADLQALGLGGYSGSITKDGTFSTRKDDEVVGTISLPSSFDVGCFFWKCFFYQNHRESTDSNYDYQDQGKRYSLETERLELIGGHTVSLAADFVVDSLRPFFDAEGRSRCALAKIRHIAADKTLGGQELVLIDNDARIRHVCAGEPGYSDTLGEVSEQRYWDPANHWMVNGICEYEGDTPAKVTDFSTHAKAFVYQESGAFGIYSFDGKAILYPSFSEIRISSIIFSNCLAIDANSNCYSLNPFDGVSRKIEIPDGYSYTDTECGYLSLNASNPNDANPMHAYVSYNGDFDYGNNYDFQVASVQLQTFNSKAYCDVYQRADNRTRYSFRSFYLAA